MTAQTKAGLMRQLLRESEYGATELAEQAGALPSQALRLIQREIAAGNVEAVGSRDMVCKGRFKMQVKIYTWCGDDDLVTAALRAAEYLRDSAPDDLGRSLSKHLFRLADPRPGLDSTK
jgi:hypothetical protein